MGSKSDSAETEFEIVDLGSQLPKDERLNGLRELFPEVFTEGRVDFAALSLSLGEVIDSGPERFGLSWPGKAEAARAIQKSSIGTLEPMREESVNWDETENLIIEGDNLEVLKILQRSYYSKIKLIYMDPPYNTGNEFVYEDDYKQGMDAYLHYTGQKDEEGNKSQSNPETSGRYHSTWLSMMYPRLLLARNLLRDDGVVFISIGDEEVGNLILMVKEVFGEENFLGLVTRVTKTGSNKGTFFAPSVDYMVVAARSVSALEGFSIAPAESYKDRYKEVDENGKKYVRNNLYQASLDPMRGCTNQRYWIKCPDGSLCIPPGESFPPESIELSKTPPQSRADRVWRWSDSRYRSEGSQLEFREVKGKDGSKLVTPEGKNSKWNVFTKQYLEDRLAKGFLPRNFLTGFENTSGTKDLKELNLRHDFDFAKPVSLLKLCIEMACDEGIILDIFAGSGTTGDATIRWNADDGGKRSYILVQLPEPTESETFKNITEITRERMRRAAGRILKNTPELALNNKEGIDLGFRSFRLSESNFIPWSDELEASSIEDKFSIFADNLTEKSTMDSRIYELILKSKRPLSSKVTEISYAGLPFYSIESSEDDRLLVYVSKEQPITLEAIEELLSDEPPLIVILESSFEGDDELKLNTLQAIRAANTNGADITIKVV